MKISQRSSMMLASACLACAAVPAHADLIVSEAAPYASGNTSYAADWFELTNTGTSAISLAGWKIDDNSNSSGAAVSLRGVSSIAAGQSVVFIEGGSTSTNDATIDAAFLSAWFGGTAPQGFVIGNYGGSGVGLSTSGDAVNIFDAANVLVTRIDFGASTVGRSFDNAAGLNNAVVSQLSAVGVNGAFTSFNGAEVGSPGLISAVPETDSVALMLAGLGTLLIVRRRRS